MVCTRKKDYSEPPAKKRKPPLDVQDLIARSFSADGVDFFQYDTRVPPRHLEQNDPFSERVDHSAGGSTIPKDGPRAEFHRFQELPCELRLLIWEASMTSRLVAVRPIPGGCHDTEHNSPKQLLPALLYVNYEARQCALRHYRWRFTVRLTVVADPRAFWMHNREDLMPDVLEQHARVVMSPTDTLGFMGWSFQKRRGVYSWKIGFHAADETTSPWEGQTTDHESQLKLAKVAFLAPRLEADPRIIRDLNSTPSWDVDGILHVKPPRAEVNKFTILGKWHDISKKTYSGHSLSIRRWAVSPIFQEWGKTRLGKGFPAFHNVETCLPDIVSVDIMKPEEGAKEIIPISHPVLHYNRLLVCNGLYMSPWE